MTIQGRMCEQLGLFIALQKCQDF